MDLQTLIVTITVGLAAVFVIRTFTRQFTSRAGKGCSSCAHGGAAERAGAARDGDLIQVEESVRQ